jgi:branched-subunit amino acid aminotransferase/4-amino-4-deoxychorismate lyase
VTDVEIYTVAPGGPRAITLEPTPSSIHDLPDDLPLGVYTAFRTFDHNKFLGLEQHLGRLQQSMDLLQWDYKLDRDRLRHALDQVCTAYPREEARVRVDVLARALPELGIDGRELITLAPFVPIAREKYLQGVRVALAPHLRRNRPRVKSADFILERRHYPRREPDAFEYLLLDDQDRLVEGSSSNFYGVRDGTVWTAGEGMLEGTARRIVLRLIAALAIPLHLEAPARAAIDRFDEAFLSSSSRGILPIVNIAGIMIGNGRPGPVTKRLMAAYEEYVAQAIAPAVS